MELEKTIKAMADVIIEESKKDPTYQLLLKANTAGEVIGLAEMVMSGIALHVLAILNEKFGVRETKEKLLLMYQLPFLQHLFEEEEKKVMNACHVDRAYARLRETILKD